MGLELNSRITGTSTGQASPKDSLNTLSILVLPISGIQEVAKYCCNSVILPKIDSKNSDSLEIKQSNKDLILEVLKNFKENLYSITHHTAKLVGLESYVEKAAELTNSFFEKIANFFFDNPSEESSIAENKKQETNLTSVSELTLLTGGHSKETQKNDHSPYSNLIGLESLEHKDEDKNRDQEVVISLNKYGERVIGAAEKSLLILARALNHIHNPELAKVEKLLADEDILNS